MIRRIERPVRTTRELGVAKRAQGLVPLVEDPGAPELALRYSNGFVTVEISHDALDRYAEANGDVPLPVHVDAQTGDRRDLRPPLARAGGLRPRRRGCARSPPAAATGSTCG